jgi:hypothetical protein
MTAAIGGGYISNWKSDFIQNAFGKDASCSRYYFDRKVAVDIGDPRSKDAKERRKVLFSHGCGYLCIPVDFPTDADKIRKLYDAALAEYKAYENLHPRPVTYQESTYIDNAGIVRKAKVTAIDLKVGGGYTTSVDQQTREFEQAKALSRKEIKTLRKQNSAVRAYRKALEKGVPFRNPFVGDGKRLYAVEYPG